MIRDIVRALLAPEHVCVRCGQPVGSGDRGEQLCVACRLDPARARLVAGLRP